jgi:hypothetical protein
MSKQATREVEFYTDGELVKTVTDKETARAIGAYKDVYNKIQSFDITSCILPGKRDGFVRHAIQAKSPKIKILCIKEYMPNMPEEFDGAQYQCGIMHTKTKQTEVVANGALERHYGGIPMLYYKLFNEHTK